MSIQSLSGYKCFIKVTFETYNESLYTDILKSAPSGPLNYFNSEKVAVSYTVPLQKHKELVESNNIGPGNDLISLFVLVEII